MKRIFTMFLSVVFFISLTESVCAAGTVFKDVAPTAYYALAVDWSVSNKIANGTSATTFSPNNYCTQGQIITFLYRAIGSPSVSGSNPYSNENITVDSYCYLPMLWAYENGIVLDTNINPMDSCTRGDTILYIWRHCGAPEVMPASQFKDLPTPNKDDVIPELTIAASWAVKQGITTGTTSNTFSPNNTCTRAQVITFLWRALSSQEKNNQDASYGSNILDASKVTYESLIKGNTELVPWHDPQDTNTIDNNIRYMLQHGEDTITFRYKGSLEDMVNIMNNGFFQNYLIGIKHYQEHGYNAVVTDTRDLTPEVLGMTEDEYWDMILEDVKSGITTYTIRFKHSGFTDEEMSKMKAAALNLAIDIHNQMWTSGSITSNMTEKEKAKVYYDWIVKNCEYDYSFSAESYVPYSVFSSGKAVCDGYTGAYNLLLKLEGIDCSTALSANHIWTTATLDGVFCHIDATWGDQYNLPADKYFAMTPENSWARFK